MQLDKLSKIIKWLFFAFNILLMIIALSSLIYIFLSIKTFSTRTFVGLAVLYFSILLVTILGCWGILKTIGLLMKVCVISFLVLLIYDLLSSYVIADIEGDKAAAKNYVEEKWAEEIKHSDSMTILQDIYECCGRNSSDDYKNILHRPLPKSCYSITGKLQEQGCISAMENFVFERIEIKWYICLYFIFMGVAAGYLAWYYTKDPNEQ